MSQDIQLPPDDLIHRTRGDVAFVVNFSGGKDSMRMLGRVRELYPKHPTFVVMADTGFEHVRPISAETWSRQQVARFDLPLTVVRNPNKTYLEMVERRRMFPSSTTRQCTSDLKRGPIEKFVRALSQKVIVNCTGIRSEESSQRSKQIPWKANKSLSVAGRSVWDWMPIFDESLGKVLSWHWQTETPLHPVYVPEFHRDGTTGGYLKRFSCRLCIFATATDLVAIEQNDPEAFELVSSLELRIGFTMRHGRSLVQIVTEAKAVPLFPVIVSPQLALF
jgi:3'-phosphoadenosine 5'-phosphosulfate sulfotransferase (PAPS reductase)/FAD synthetase